MRKTLISIFFVSLLFTSPVHGKDATIKDATIYGIDLQTCVWVLEHKDKFYGPLLNYIGGHISGVNRAHFLDTKVAWPQIKLKIDDLFHLALKKCRPTPR